MKRYNLEPDCSVDPSNGSMYERDDGAYVEFEEADKLIADLRKRLEEAEECLIKTRHKREGAERRAEAAEKEVEQLKDELHYINLKPCPQCEQLEAKLARYEGAVEVEVDVPHYFKCITVTVPEEYCGQRVTVLVMRKEEGE